MPNRSNDYQLPSWPPTQITREIWNAVLGDIGFRLREREALEASFEVLQHEGVQAALDYIQVSIAPQLSDLQETIQQSKEQIDDLFEGNAPNAHKLGGQLPAYYAKSSDLQNLLQVVGEKADADEVTLLIQQRIAALVDSSPATLDTLKELAAALNNDANFATTMANSLADLETKIKQAGLPVGTTIMMPGNGNTPPPGFLLMNGAPCTSAYPQLRAWLLDNGATVNGNGDPVIQDMGGYFPRGWRSGQVVDSGRVFGSTQAQSTQDMFAAIDANQGARVRFQSISPVPAWTGNKNDDDSVGGITGNYTSGVGVYPIGTGETRPVNKTFTYWIKAYAADQVPGSVDFAALANNVQGLKSVVFSTGDMAFSGYMASEFGSGLSVALRGFVSPQQTWSLGASLVVAHGLSFAPKDVILIFVCKANGLGGYVIGERIVFSGSTAMRDENYAESGYTIMTDATNIRIAFANAGVHYANKTGGGVGRFGPNYFDVIVVGRP